MYSKLNRRTFLSAMIRTAGYLSVANLGWLPSSGTARAASISPVSGAVPLAPNIEPLVRFLEETPRERLLEETAKRIRQGLVYRELLAALLLAGVRNIQPRPVGYKFHAVMVVNSVHLTRDASPPEQQWLPLFWALDYFKAAQAQDVREGDWTLAPARESVLPSKPQAREAFADAMARWDEPAADAAVAVLARSVKPQELFETLCLYGARDYRDIGHKAIFMANGWRALEAIGFRHAEPVARSLAYAFLAHSGSNPAASDQLADRPWRLNRTLVGKIRSDWRAGKPDAAATRELLTVFREGGYEDASRTVVELINRGVAVESVWDAVFCGAAELLMRRPGIVSLHAVTTTNGIHYSYRTSADDTTRRLLLLQNAAFLPLFRGNAGSARAPGIDALEPLPPENAQEQALEDIFTAVSRNRMEAAQRALGFLQHGGAPQAFLAEARRLLVRKGRGPHDYKLTAAALEDYGHVSPAWRDRYLAASVFNLRGLGDPDNPLIERARTALEG